MAGGKETPRQKMIGMMYLVLTALLALNVSKEIINAFVKLNDKIEDGNHIVDAKIAEALAKFENMMAVPQTRASTKPWKERADKIFEQAYTLNNFLMTETNDMIKTVEGVDWLRDSTVKDLKGKPLKNFRSLMSLSGKDNYDVPTQMFVGGDPKQPNERGKKIRTDIEKLRDDMCTTMATYTEGTKKWTFDPKVAKGYDPKEKSTWKKLDDALKTCNPIDADRIKQVYKTLSYPIVLKEYDQEVSWQGGMFDRAPLVAAIAMFTSIRGDIKTAEAIALDHLTTKLEQPLIKINKIEPLAFARTGYLNTGDTMDLKVMIAAYDSSDTPIIRYDMGSGEQEIKGAIKIKADSPGEKEIKGTIGVKQKGELVWKPWSFRYEVGQPMGVISPIEMNVLYAGYENKVQATASGFPNEKVTLSIPGASQLSKGAQNVYTVKVPATMVGKTVKASVSGAGKQVGTMDFRIRSLPKPSSYLGSVPNTESRISRSQLAAALNSGVRIGYDESIPLKVAFKVTKFEVVVQVGAATKTIQCAGALTPEARTLINQLKPGAALTITGIRGAGPAGEVRCAPLALVIQ